MNNERIIYRCSCYGINRYGYKYYIIFEVEYCFGKYSLCTYINDEYKIHSVKKFNNDYKQVVTYCKHLIKLINSICKNVDLYYNRYYSKYAF